MNDLKPFDVADLTDEQINDAQTSLLRAWVNAAGDRVSNYYKIETVASFQVAPLVNHPGALTALDKMITTLKQVYKDRDPKIEARYGNETTVVVWVEDDTLRSGLRYARTRALEERATQAAEAEAEENEEVSADAS